MADFRLGLETAVIIGLARRLAKTLTDHDPLSEKVHHNKLSFLRCFGHGGGIGCNRPGAGPRTAGDRDGGQESVSAAAEDAGVPEQAESSARQASGSSFYAGMRILPRPQREAMFAVYGFCRAVDDVADDGGTRPERQRGLDRWRADIEALYAGRTTPATAALAEPVRTFGLDKQDFLAVIDGMAMDAVEDIRAPDEATLDLYCDRVASAVGRLSVRIFGIMGPNGIDLAHHLGRALQKTNILRDLEEDAEMGRLYLPRRGVASCRHQRHRTQSGDGPSGARPGLRAADRGGAGPFRRRRCHHGGRAAQDHARAAAHGRRCTGRCSRRSRCGGSRRRGPASGVPKYRLLFAVLRHGLF